MQPEPSPSLLDRVFAKVDEKVGPSRVKYRPACQDVREMLIECVIESDCMKEPNAKLKYGVIAYQTVHEGEDQQGMQGHSLRLHALSEIAGHLDQALLQG